MLIAYVRSATQPNGCHWSISTLLPAQASGRRCGEFSGRQRTIQDSIEGTGERTPRELRRVTRPRDCHDVETIYYLYLVNIMTNTSLLFSSSSRSNVLCCFFAGRPMLVSVCSPTGSVQLSAAWLTLKDQVPRETSRQHA